MNAAYQKYLRSADWIIKKAKLVNFHNKHKIPVACWWCADTQDLQVHHRHYRRIFKEKMTDLVFLCKKCHQKESRNKGSFERALCERLMRRIEYIYGKK